MGKIRVKTLGDEEAEKKQKEELKKKKEARLQKHELSDSGQAKKAEKKAVVEPEEKAAEIKTEAKLEEKAEAPELKKEKKEKFQETKKAYHSSQYLSLVGEVDKKKTYSLSEALSLLEKLQRNNLPAGKHGFDETVELHINTLTNGVSGNVTLPHGTGKKTRVVIASDALIAEVEKGVINFDILVAEPTMMAKLAKVARVLGPRGLMPNPKNGTISPKPEEVVKKYEGGQISFKTESKAPILHLTVGKMSFGPKKLEENIEVMVKAVKKSNIKDATLKSTMSPGIKIQV